MRKQIEGQLSLFDFIPKPEPKSQWVLPCDTCGYDIKGCCDYDYHKNNDYCVLGDKWIPKNDSEMAPGYYKAPGGEDAQICKHSGHTCNKQELWKIADTLDEIMCPHVCCRSCNTRLCGARCNGSEEPKADIVKMFGKEWNPLSEKPEGITQYDDLEILGPYKSVYGERWSCCEAKLKDGEVVAYNVPWDIPKPDWQFWRLKEKVYPVDIIGICDDPVCPKCGYEFETTKSCKRYEVDCERCPECHVRVDWTPWHRANDEEDEG